MQQDSNLALIQRVFLHYEFCQPDNVFSDFLPPSLRFFQISFTLFPSSLLCFLCDPSPSFQFLYLFISLTLLSQPVSSIFYLLFFLI